MFSSFNPLTNSVQETEPRTHQPFDGWSLDDRDVTAIKSWMPIWEWFYHHYFRVKIQGWEHIPPEGRMLMVGSHNGGLASPDMFMSMYAWFRRFGPERLAYGLMHPNVWKVAPEIAKQAVQCGALIAHPKTAMAALRREAAVLVYPGGGDDAFRLHRLRHQIYLAGRKGFIKLALREEAPIIPIISCGAHDTLMVVADCYEFMQQLHQGGMPWLFGVDPTIFPIYVGFPWILGVGPIPNLPLPMPIHLRICPPILFSKYGREAANDREYVDACYETVVMEMQKQLDDLVASVSV